jgi:hypothetical protein
MTVYIHEIPSLVALLFKFALLYYAYRSPRRNSLTLAYLALLVSLSVLNAVEFLGIYYYERHGLSPGLMWFGFSFFAALAPSIALILHVSLRLSVDATDRPKWRPLFLLVYVPIVPLEYLLLFTDELVQGFVPFKYSIIREPGPLYFLFESYVVTYLLAALAYLVYGARPSRRSALARTRNRLWLLGLTPLVLMMLYLTVAGYVGWPKFTSTFYFPLAITVFLIVTTYAIYQYRLFDIEFYIPGSAVRARKTALYRRLQATVAELADLGSADEALSRVADIFKCPVALVGGWRPVLAHAGDGSLEIAQFPGEPLEKIDRIVVANEIETAMPELHRVMQQFRVAAIAPFHPRSRTAVSFLLLGESFSNTVYTPLDFKKVERLFDRLGEFFLDKLASLRTELTLAEDQQRELTSAMAETTKDLVRLREENALLRDTNFRLMRENHVVRQALDSRTRQRKTAPVLTLALKPATDWSKTLREQLEQSEARLIEEALRQSNGNRSKAARLLGIRPKTLRNKLERHSLTKHESNADEGAND